MYTQPTIDFSNRYQPRSAPSKEPFLTAILITFGLYTILATGIFFLTLATLYFTLWKLPTQEDLPGVLLLFRLALSVAVLLSVRSLWRYYSEES